MRRFVAGILLLLFSALNIYADSGIVRDTVSISQKVDFKYDLLNMETIRLHPVNGLDLQESVSFIFHPDSNTVFSANLKAQYAFLPHIVEPELALNLNKFNRHFFSLTAGRELHDWKRDSYTEMKWIKNSFSVLFPHKNYKALVDKMYFSASYSFKPTERALVKAVYDRYDLKSIENHSTFALFHNGRNYDPNVPANVYIDSIAVLSDRNGNSAIELESEFPLGSHDYSPLLNINLRYVNHVKVLNPQLTISQTFWHSKFDMLHWRINGGFFIGNDINSLSFHEWTHFQTSRKFFPVRNERTGIVGFVARESYELSTNDWHIDASFRLFKERLLLLHCPLFQYIMVGESLVLSNVYSAQRDKIYTEVGYEFLNVFNAFHIGVFSVFDGKQYKETTIRMGIIPQPMPHKKK